MAVSISNLAYNSRHFASALPAPLISFESSSCTVVLRSGIKEILTINLDQSTEVRINRTIIDYLRIQEAHACEFSLTATDNTGASHSVSFYAVSHNGLLAQSPYDTFANTQFATAFKVKKVSPKCTDYLYVSHIGKQPPTQAKVKLYSDSEATPAETTILPENHALYSSFEINIEELLAEHSDIKDIYLIEINCDGRVMNYIINPWAVQASAVFTNPFGFLEGVEFFETVEMEEEITSDTAKIGNENYIVRNMTERKLTIITSVNEWNSSGFFTAGLSPIIRVTLPGDPMQLETKYVPSAINISGSKGERKCKIECLPFSSIY